MAIDDLLSSRGIIARLKASSKKQVLQELARRGADITGVHERTIFDLLLERERLGSTGIGRGVAIPHAKVPGIEQMTGLFARLEEPVEFEAIDERPVDLVFVLLAPQGAGADHLKALARVSRLLRNEDTVRRLRGSDRAEALFAVLTDEIEQPAA